MNRYLGLDVGTKRIGVAISVPVLNIARPLTTISRQPEDRSIDEIKKLCDQYDVSALVIGLPINMDGSVGFQAEDVQKYAKLIQKKLNIEIIYEDERLTSQEAERILIEQGKKPSRNKHLVDMASAALILEQYLDKRR